MLILDKKLKEAFQHGFPNGAIPREEGLVFPENPGDQQYGNLAFFQFSEVIIPILIFYPDDQGRVEAIDEFLCMGWAVGRQVKNFVGQGVIFPDLVPARRKEAQDDLKV